MKRRLVLFVVLTSACLVNAEPIRQPPDLEPGDQYRLAFVTSTTTTATSPDIETYNAFVQATADAAPIGDWGFAWYAIAQTETGDPSPSVPCGVAMQCCLARDR